MSAELRFPSMRRLAPIALALSFGACDWFTDFKDQPRIEPWESYALITDDSAAAVRIPFRGQPQFSVPVTGSVAPGYWVSYFPGVPQLDSLSVLDNPTAATEASLLNGRLHYQINCAVCHGVAGQGNGPATRYGMIPMPIVSAATQARTDGYLFGIIRNGRGAMPNYNRIEEADRWDVVNYIRGLQGRYPVDTSALAAPGVTGDAIPGASRTAPTRPAPHAVGIVGPSPLGAGAPPVPGAAAADSQPPAGTTPPDTSAQPRERL